MYGMFLYRRGGGFCGTGEGTAVGTNPIIGTGAGCTSTALPTGANNGGGAPGSANGRPGSSALIVSSPGSMTSGGG